MSGTYLKMEHIWNDIRVELLDLRMHYLDDSRDERTFYLPRPFKTEAAFHILPVGKIRTIPFGFKNSHLKVIADEYLSDDFYKDRRYHP